MVFRGDIYCQHSTSQYNTYNTHTCTFRPNMPNNPHPESIRKHGRRLLDMQQVAEQRPFTHVLDNNTSTGKHLQLSLQATEEHIITLLKCQTSEASAPTSKLYDPRLFFVRRRHDRRYTQTPEISAHDHRETPQREYTPMHRYMIQQAVLVVSSPCCGVLRTVVTERSARSLAAA